MIIMQGLEAVTGLGMRIDVNYWILQANPEYFNILGWLRYFPWLKDELLIDRWYISFFKDIVDEPSE